jgi:hypothetical protein
MDGFNVPSFYTHVQEDLLTFLMSICIKVLAYDHAINPSGKQLAKLGQKLKDTLRSQRIQTSSWSKN